jgi:hypothetical protein
MRAPLVIALVICGCHSPRLAELRGHVVVSGGDGSAVTVRAVGPASASASTNAAGDYHLIDLPAGDYDLVFTADDTIEKTRTARVLVSGAIATAPTVQLTGAGSIDGTITIAGRAGAGATVFVEGGRAVATSDGNGHYHLAGVAAGAVTIAAVLAGYRPGSLAAVNVARGQITTAATLDLTPDDGSFTPAALAGKALRIDRSDHSGTQVTATLGTQTFTASTASDGSYRIGGIPSGLYRLDFDYDGHHEAIPQVLAQAGATGQVIDGTLYPLADNPLELPIARRIGDVADLVLVDGDRVLSLVANPDGVTHTLALVALASGAATVLASDVLSLSSLRVTTDRSRVLYLAGAKNGPTALRIVAFDGTAPITLAASIDGAYALLPGDTRVLYGAGKNVHVVSTSGAPDTVLLSAVAGFQLDASRTHVMYESCSTSCTISVQAIDSGTPTQILSNVSDYFSLAADGTHAVTIQSYDYAQKTGQIILGSAGMAPLMVWQGIIAPYFHYSHDGRLLLFLNDAGDLHAVDLQSATPAAVLVALNVGANYVDNLVVAGGRMLYQRDVVSVAAARLFTLGQKPVSGGDEITLGTHVSSFAVFSDGLHSVFVDNADQSGFGRLRTADASGAGATLVDGGASNASFSRDGVYVLYAGQHPTRNDAFLLRSVATKGGTPIDLGELAAPPTIVAAPSGARVAFRGSDRIARLVAPSGGTAQAAGIGDVLWASDTRVVIILRDQPPPYRHQDGVYVLELTP